MHRAPHALAPLAPGLERLKEGPITPRTAIRTVLAAHADDGHRYEAAVCRLRQIQGGKDFEAKIALEAAITADWCGATLKPKPPSRPLWP
jgi:hypothetical protein